jgi:hypothetical protein
MSPTHPKCPLRTAKAAQVAGFGRVKPLHAVLEKASATARLRIPLSCFASSYPVRGGRVHIEGANYWLCF